MKLAIGKKQNMTQYFDSEGRVFPATIVATGPAVVTQVKAKDTDGYCAVQVGAGVRNTKRINKAQKGHMKELGNFSSLKEFRITPEIAGTMKRGDVIDFSVFAPGDKITVTGVTKGKGFQGVVKRHGFHGGPRSHGQKHSEREPGSIGGGLRTRVPKGMRMAGRMGSDTVTVKNLKVLAIDADTQSLLISGAVPGRRGTVLYIQGK